MWSIGDALDEFLLAPALQPRCDDLVFRATGGGWSNEAIVVAVCGVRGIHVVDPPLYDAVSLKYEVKCGTFEEAFRACARPYSTAGHRDWRDFDLDVLRECHLAFAALQMPAWLEELRLEEEWAEHLRRLG
jgi:hypothetical protein